MLNVNFDQIVGKIRAMHAVGQPPMAGTDCSAFRYLKEAHIPYSRLHDVGIYKLLPMVDISCIFPDFSKDEQDPANYDFEYTDYLISEMMNNDCPPIFRLGETIENAVDRGFRPRYIHAPADPHKWARICEQIIRHYNEGWADGFRFGIRYWEIWNEADNGFQVGEGPVKAGGPYRDINHMWVGSFRQCYELYVIAAKHLKACFGDQIMVGGYGSSGLYAIFIEPEKYGAPVALQKNYRPRYELMLQFFYEFLDYVKEQNAPLDFFSWHSYSDVDRSVAMEQFVERTLRERGFDCEILLDEWNNAPAPEKIGTSYAAAHAAAMLLAMQNTELTVMNYYDARIVSGDYCGMFNPVLRTPYCLYYAFKAFGELYCLGDQAKCTVEGEGLYAVAATNGGKKAVLLTNIGADQRVETNLQGFEVYLIDETHRMERVDWDPSSFELKENQTVYLVK